MDRNKRKAWHFAHFLHKAPPNTLAKRIRYCFANFCASKIRLLQTECGEWMMSDIVVDLDLRSPEDDAFLAATLDAFVAKQMNGTGATDDGPQMMVRTAFRPDGEICKKVIFQSQRWAEAFVAYWESRKLQANAV